MLKEFITDYFTYLDVIALLWFVSIWSGYFLFTSKKRNNKPNLQYYLDFWRESWALSLTKRSNRIMDSQVINALIQKETFFASTTILILASTIALMGLRDEVNSMVVDIPIIQFSTTALWEIKVSILIVIFIYAFFKFSWSIRQHTYSAILLGSIPEPDTDEEAARDQALRLARLSSLGAENFNDGIRAYYFALAELSWFINPWVFMLASTWVVGVLYRREYHSRALKLLSTKQD